MAAYPLSQSLLRLPADQDELNATLEAKYIQSQEERLRVHLAAKCLADQVYDALHEPCDTCSSERVEVRYDIDPGVVRVAPCRECRRADFAAFMSKLAREAEESCQPPTLPSYHRLECDCPECLTVAETGIETRDPFTLEPDPIVLTDEEIREAEHRNCKGYTGPLRPRDLWEDGK